MAELTFKKKTCRFLPILAIPKRRRVADQKRFSLARPQHDHKPMGHLAQTNEGNAAIISAAGNVGW